MYNIIITALFLLFYASLSRADQKPVIVLDLDNTLLHNRIDSGQVENSLIYKFFLNHQVITDHDSKMKGGCYKLPAYTNAFIRYLRANFSIHFYSAGEKRRNKFVTNKLWERTSDNKTTPSWIVKSHKHLVSNKKDLNVILDALPEPKPSLDNTVLIDDNKIYMAEGQKNNFFLINPASPGDLLLAYIYYFKLIQSQNIVKDDENDKAKDDIITLQKILAANTHDKDNYFGTKILPYYKLLYITYYLDLALNRHITENTSISQSIPTLETPFPTTLTEDDLEKYRKGLEILKQYEQKQDLEPQIPEIEELLFSKECSVNFGEFNKHQTWEIYRKLKIADIFEKEYSLMLNNLDNLKIAIEQTQKLFKDINTQDHRIIKSHALLRVNLKKDKKTNNNHISSFIETGLLIHKFDEKTIKLQVKKVDKNNHDNEIETLNRFNALKKTLKHTMTSKETRGALNELDKIIQQLFMPQLNLPAYPN